jgi:hypothetical protein
MLIATWVIGFFIFNAGPFIHLVLILAFIAILLKVIQEDKMEKYK